MLNFDSFPSAFNFALQQSIQRWFMVEGDLHYSYQEGETPVTHVVPSAVLNAVHPQLTQALSAMQSWHNKRMPRTLGKRHLFAQVMAFCSPWLLTDTNGVTYTVGSLDLFRAWSETEQEAKITISAYVTAADKCVPSCDYVQALQVYALTVTGAALDARLDPGWRERFVIGAALGLTRQALARFTTTRAAASQETNVLPEALYG